ncbi:PREDICTED: ashwin, partial [Fulmarus glacialis]|uniref:ashwin n=1 Tax=Fulmarus glacialis TaxID=30455 RepID=UPI00051B54B0
GNSYPPPPARGAFSPSPCSFQPLYRSQRVPHKRSGEKTNKQTKPKSLDPAVSDTDENSPSYTKISSRGAQGTCAQMQLTKSSSHQWQETRKDAQEESYEEIYEEMRLQKNILVKNDVKIDKDGLTDLYIQHAIPLPQRDLPKSRWGKIMEKKRQQNESKSENTSVTTVEGLRKRPLIVFDGNSTSTSIKVKKTENGAADRLKPPPAGSTTNTVRRLSVPSNASTYISASSFSEDAKLGMRNNEAKQNNISKTNSSVLASLKVYPLSPVAGTTVVKLKRAVPKEESDLPNDLKPTEAKKKIQHVTWP